MFCQKCGKENSDDAIFCDSCGAAINPMPESQISSKTYAIGFSKPQIIGLIGCICLIIGCFTPLVSAPIFGSFNYFHNGSGDGVIILVLTLISIVTILHNEYIKFLFIPGLLSLCIIVYDFFNIDNIISSLQSQNFGMFNILASSVQIEYGWAFLIIGSIMIIIVPIIDVMAP
jgi:hypothetical protein